MVREVSATIDTAIVQPVTGPTYLLEINTDPVLRYSCRQELSWGGFTWLTVGAKVDRFNAQAARILLPNHENTGSGLSLNDELRDVYVRIFEHHDSDAEEVFRGYGDDVSIGLMNIVLNLNATARDQATAPRLRVTWPTFTRMPALGSTIVLGDITVHVES